MPQQLAPFRLAVDLGTARTAAAVAVEGGVPQLLALGASGPTMPSVLFREDDGTFLAGEEAERRGDADPARVAREFARRLTDEAPVTVAGQVFTAEALTVLLLQQVVRTATERQGSAPSAVVLSCPAGWSGDQRQAFSEAVAAADVGPVRLVSGAEAVATAYAARRPVDVGGRVLVVDLGATLDVAVLEQTEIGFAVRGVPESSDAIGGAAFDEAVYRLVLGGLGDRVRDLDRTDPDVLARLARVRQACVRAKEALSTETEAGVPVELPEWSTTVRLTRPELSSLIRPGIRDAAALVTRVLRSAAVSPTDLSAVVGLGGSSVIPMVAPMLERELGVPFTLDLDPKRDVALGSLLVGQPPAPEGTAMPVAAPPRPVASPPTPVRLPTPVAVPADTLPQPQPQPRRAATWVPTSAATPLRAPLPAETAPTAPDSWLSSVLTDSMPAAPGRENAAAGGPSWSPTPPGGAASPPTGGGYTGGPPPGYAGGPPPGSPGGPAYGAGGPPPGTPGGPRRPAGPPPGSGSGGGSSRRLLLIIGASIVALALLVGIGVLVVRAVTKPDQVAAPPPVAPLPTAGPVSGSPTSSGSPTASGSPAAPVTTPSTPPPGQQPTPPTALPASAALPVTTAVVPIKVDGERDLYLVDTTKQSKPVRLPTPDGSDSSPALPPQRNTIIYLNENQPRVMAADGTGDRPLVDQLPKGCDSVDHLSWSTTDTNLLVLQCQSDAGKYTIQEVKLDGTLVRRLNIAKDDIDDVSMSVDGLTLVYWATNNDKLDGGSIYSIPVDGSDQPTRLTKEPAGTDADPVWSPDGSQIAFRRRVPNGTEDGNYDVWVMNFDGSNPEPVAETPATDAKPSWSPDGKQLLIISNRDSAVGGPGKTWDLWLTRVKDGRVLRSMGLKAEGVTTPFWNNR